MHYSMGSSFLQGEETGFHEHLFICKGGRVKYLFTHLFAFSWAELKPAFCLALPFVCISLPACLKAPRSSGDFPDKTDANSFFSGASRSSVIQCKPGGNCPSRHRGMTRQLSPLSVAEDSAAPILELQNRSPSGICRHSRVERQSRSGRNHGRTPLQRWGRAWACWGWFCLSRSLASPGWGGKVARMGGEAWDLQVHGVRWEDPQSWLSLAHG